MEGRASCGGACVVGCWIKTTRFSYDRIACVIECPVDSSDHVRVPVSMRGDVGIIGDVRRGPWGTEN
jgi:hypothetical protein